MMVLRSTPHTALERSHIHVLNVFPARHPGGISRAHYARMLAIAENARTETGHRVHGYWMGQKGAAQRYFVRSFSGARAHRIVAPLQIHILCSTHTHTYFRLQEVPPMSRQSTRWWCRWWIARCATSGWCSWTWRRAWSVPVIRRVARMRVR